MHQPKKLRILCLGDSLTAGLTRAGERYGGTYQPYHEEMERTLVRVFGELATTTTSSSTNTNTNGSHKSHNSDAGGGSGNGTGGGVLLYDSIDIDVVEDGEDGSRVVSDSGQIPDFRSRVREHFKEGANTRILRLVGAGSKPFDWTIVLGGTNDLVLYEADQIYEALKKIWSVALKKKSKVLALTVPEAGIRNPSGPPGRVHAQRDRLNALIKGHKQENFYVFDLHDNMSEKEVREAWDNDMVHFRPEGYDLIGRKVGVALAGILTGRKITLEGDKIIIIQKEKEKEKEKEKSSSSTGKTAANTGSSASAASPPPTSSKRRRTEFRDDQMAFEEESGDAARLSQGYVVVRRKDLD